MILHSDFSRIQHAGSFCELKELTHQATLSLGFDGFMYGVAWREDALSSDLQKFIFGTYAQDFIEKYQTNDWFRLDPAMKFITREHLPFVWEKDTLTDPEGVQVLRHAQHTSGIVFPITSSSLRIAAFGVANFETKPGFADSAEKALPFGQSLCLYVHHAAIRLLRMTARCPLKDITSRERECLQLAAKGHRDAEIAGLLGITPRTVISHLNSAKEKLAADTRPQMIARAIALNVIAL